MRNRVINPILLMMLALISGRGLAVTAAPLPHGLTVVLASDGLELAEGQSQAKTQITITNNYDIPVSVSFNANVSNRLVNSGGAVFSEDLLAKVLHIEQPIIRLEPRQSMTQILVLNDDKALPPGNLLATLHIKQESTVQSGVSIKPVIDVPLVLLKSSGARSEIHLERFTQPHVMVNFPSVATAYFRNVGNTISIPRGRIVIRDRAGSEVAEGILNVSSLAVLPGQTMALETPLRPLRTTLLPGKYIAEIAFRANADQSSNTRASMTTWYLSIWHIVVALGLLGGVAGGIHNIVHRLRHRTKHVAKVMERSQRRPRLIGRDIT